MRPSKEGPEGAAEDDRTAELRGAAERHEKAKREWKDAEKNVAFKLKFERKLKEKAERENAKPIDKQLAEQAEQERIAAEQAASEMRRAAVTAFFCLFPFSGARILKEIECHQQGNQISHIFSRASS